MCQKMETHTYRSHSEFNDHAADRKERAKQRRELERQVAPPGKETSLNGHCLACDSQANFQVSWVHSDMVTPNWREILSCSSCSMNNRQRALIATMQDLTRQFDSPKVYMAEQISPSYRFLKDQFPDLMGSEFLGGQTPLGKKNDNGLRNEDGTQLTFSDNSFDVVISQDVLEHIFDYKKAISEMARVLRPGGLLFMTVPFVLNQYDHLKKADKDAQGNLTFLEEPEYHGDPLNPENGVLCYRYYGWKLLDQLQELGFQSAEIRDVWSQKNGHLGSHGLQIIVAYR